MSVIGTSDVHGYVEPRSLTVKDDAGTVQKIQRGGLALFGGYLANLRAKSPVLLLDAGDLFQGTLVSNLGEGQVVIDAYNILGYSAAALGNHEFDFGPAGPVSVATKPEEDATGALKERIAAAKFPFLSANVLDKKTGRPVAWPNIAPSTRLVIGGVPIGIIGAITEDTPRTTNILNLRDVEIAQLVPAVRAEAQALRAQGVAAVVLSVHEGANCTSFADPHDLSSCRNNDAHILKVAEQLGGYVDAIVAGHSHAGVAHFVGDIPVIQAFAMGQAFGRLDLLFRQGKAGYQLDKSRTRIYPPTELCSVQLPPAGSQPSDISAPAAVEAPVAAAGSAPSAPKPPGWRCDPRYLAGKPLLPAVYEGAPVQPSAQVQAVLAPHIEKAAARRATPLGVTLAAKLHRNYKAESPLGLLLAELMRLGAARATGQQVDLALQNGGGIRNELPAGPLTYGDLFEVLPFDNRLALMQLTGAQLKQLFLRNLQSGHGVLVPSGMKIQARCSGPDLQVSVLDGAGKPISETRSYTVAVSDFLASGGDNFGEIIKSMPQGAVKFYENLNLREVIATELKQYRGPLLTAQPLPMLLQLEKPRPISCP